MEGCFPFEIFLLAIPISFLSFLFGVDAKKKFGKFRRVIDISFLSFFFFFYEKYSAYTIALEFLHDSNIRKESDDKI